MPILQPLTPQAAPQAAPQASTTPDPAQLMPPLNLVATGDIPAISFPPEPKDRSLSPLSAYVAQNLDQIIRTGIDCTIVGKLSVLYNPVKTSKEAIHKAYADGTLDKLAPEVKSSIPKLRPLATRTVHTADSSPPETPGVAAPASGPSTALAGPQNPQATPPQETAPAAPIKLDRRSHSARLQAVQRQNKSADSAPRTVLDNISARPI